MLSSNIMDPMEILMEDKLFLDFVRCQNQVRKLKMFLMSTLSLEDMGVTRIYLEKWYGIACQLGKGGKWDSDGTWVTAADFM